MHANYLSNLGREKESNHLELKGKAGSKNTEAYVKVESSYGGVDLRP